MNYQFCTDALRMKKNILRTKSTIIQFFFDFNPIIYTTYI